MISKCSTRVANFFKSWQLLLQTHTTIIHASLSISNWHNSEILSYTFGLSEFNNKKIQVARKVKNAELKLFINDKEVAVSKNFKPDNGKPCPGYNMPSVTKFSNLFLKHHT